MNEAHTQATHGIQKHKWSPPASFSTLSSLCSSIRTSIQRHKNSFCSLDQQAIPLVKPVNSASLCPKPSPRTLHSPLSKPLLLTTPTLPSDRTYFCILLPQFPDHWKCSHSLYRSLSLVGLSLSRILWTCDLFQRKDCFVC